MSVAVSATSPCSPTARSGGETVQIDSHLAGVCRGRDLSNPGGGHAGQHVACSAGRHARIAREIDCNAAVRGRHERPRPLEHDVHAVRRGQTARRRDAFRLDFLR